MGDKSPMKRDKKKKKADKNKKAANVGVQPIIPTMQPAPKN